MASTKVGALLELQFSSGFEVKVWAKTYRTLILYYLERGHDLESATTHSSTGADMAVEKLRQRMPKEEE